MKTGTETDREGNPLRKYHRAGMLVDADGNRRPDEKWVWTHKLEDECSACENGTIPDWVKKSPS